MAKRYVGDEKDLRVRKSKKAIKTAALQLMQDDPDKTPSVKSVIEKAEVNKSTFYYHFESVQDLLDQMEGELFEKTAEGFMASVSLAQDKPEEFLAKFAEFAYAPESTALRGKSSTKASLLHSVISQMDDQVKAGVDAAVLEVLLIGLWGFSRRVDKDGFANATPSLSRLVQEGLKAPKT